MARPVEPRVPRFTAEIAPSPGTSSRRARTSTRCSSRAALRWMHPVVDELVLDREVMELPAADAQQFVVFLPADDRTAVALNRLRVDAGPALRAAN